MLTSFKVAFTLDKTNKPFSLTSIPSHSDNCSALLLLSLLPALVTKTVGTRKFPLSSTSFLKALGANGRIFFPLTMTPSMSKRKPKLTSCEVEEEEDGEAELEDALCNRRHDDDDEDGAAG